MLGFDTSHKFVRGIALRRPTSSARWHGATDNLCELPDRQCSQADVRHHGEDCSGLSSNVQPQMSSIVVSSPGKKANGDHHTRHKFKLNRSAALNQHTISNYKMQYAQLCHSPVEPAVSVSGVYPVHCTLYIVHTHLKECRPSLAVLIL